MKVTVKTCLNHHETYDTGTPESVDIAIRKCTLAINNPACQHCSKKYFGDNSALNAVEKGLEKIENIQTRKALILKLTLLRNIGELMDRLRAYHSTLQERHIAGMERKYRVGKSFSELVLGQLDDEVFEENYKTLWIDCILFLQISVRGIKENNYLDMMKFEEIKIRRDAQLQVWMNDFNNASKEKS